MASTKKQRGMVFHQEGATTPAAAPAGNHPPACFIDPKPGKASEGGMEKNTCVTYKEADMIDKPNMYPSKEAIGTSGGVPAMKHPASSNPQSDNLSPDCTIEGISVTLDNNGMWNEFFRCNTEMILTKQGSRMFPYCRFRISGLQPSKKYSLIMDIQPVDSSRYKWICNSWQVAGKAECHVKSQPFAHPESPATGQHWMQNPVSFYKLKLTNNITDQEGNTVLHPMHRYLPRLHVVQTDKAAKDIKLSAASVVTFTFPQTGFMAVTAYQNSQFAQLKVEYNPFTKGLKEDSSSLLGLKLKLNSGKDLHKDGGMSTNEQHPLKKSLKSLLANHKPRSSKPADSKPSVSGENQKDSTTNSDQSAAKVTEGSLGNSRPPQKLFSDLIREAHVSLQRCNLEQLGINNSTSHRTERSNTITTAVKSNRQDFSKRESVSVRTHKDLSPAKTGEAVVNTKVKGEKDHLKSVNCKDTVGTDCSNVNNVATPAVPQNSSVDSDHHFKPEEQSEVKVRHKRPAPLPLPALALFLKQHSTKSKKSKSKPGSPPALPSESLSEPQSSCKDAEAAAGQPATGPSMDLTGDIANGDKSDNRAFGHTTADLDPDGPVLNISGPTWQPSSLSSSDTVAKTGPEGSRTDDFFDSISVAESTGPEPAVPDGTPVLPNPDQPFCILGTSMSIISPTLSTSSLSPILSPPHDAVLLTPNSPQTAISTEPLPSHSPAMKSDYLLPDPECSSLGFESLSPASSPEPLPSLPASLTLQLASATSQPTPQALPPEELPHSEDSAASVFKWHTVLPPPEPYIDNSFTTFQPTPQTVPLTSVTSPLLPSQTCSQPEPQTFDSSTSTPPPDPAPSFQENEQSMPFPAELSPLALQLPLSPTFSSLDGDGLSPTPSLTDLVHFFSTNDDLGMEVDFSNTEAVAVPCPPPSTVEANAREVSQHVQPIQANKPSKRKKKLRRQKLGQTDLEQKIDDATYTRMQPNLEEVEEQLFISFTSKEALKLHVVDSSEEPVSVPQRTPEGHLQEITDTAENDKNLVVVASSLPDSIHPHNFPAKLWRLVNNLENKAICWDSHGDAIIIDQHLFERQILSQSTTNSDSTEAFKTTNFTSFVRQLNLYGFRKHDPAIKDNHPPTGDSGMYHHFHNPNFKRNHPERVASLKRLTVNNKAKIQAGLNVNCRPPGQHQRFSGGNDGKDKNVKQAETVESLQEKITAFEKILLRNLKLMRHRQVIHPVLQEVGLKMNLLDPTQSIDLQYLGVRLPIPPPGVSLEPLTQELLPPQGVCAAFVSRTGKTTDVTQIKGWREKFIPSETPPTPAPPKPEAASQCSDPPKKNLSAFCSDMLDEYLENEGKLIDERAASFSQPQVEPLVYELPTRSTSYVRTLDSVLKKNTVGSPTSDLISGFIPPSKRPKLTLKETRTSRRETMRQKGSKQNKPRPELAAAPSPADFNQRGPKRNKHRPEPAATHSPVNLNPVPKQLALQFPDPVSSQPPTVKKGKRLKPKTSSKTLSLSKSTVSQPGVSEDMAPLESDSELGPGFDQSNNACRTDGRPVMTRALLKQKDLEDGVVWEGRARTSINEERASIALTSLFTLMGFVRENPTAPIQLVRRRAPPCLNDFCRLGCVCSSLSHCSRTSHCGRPACMFGCSCLKQKVVLLKNLDGSDSSPSRHGNNKKKKRKRRMKMAYILKEADSVSQPAERVQTLWKRDDRDWDPEPTHIPKPATSFSPPVAAEGHSSCARVRGYRGKKIIHKQKQNEPMKDVEKKVKRARMVSLKQKEQKSRETKTRTASATPGDPVPPGPSEQPPSPPAEPPPKPSKRLIIVAECKWASKADQSFVLKDLCERMAWDQLEKPFWIKKYKINPVGQTVEESSSGRCIQYKIHITRPSEDLIKTAKPVKPVQPGTERETQQEQQDHLKQAEPIADWQQEVKEEEEEPPEKWHVKEEEEESFEDWQQEVEEEEMEPLQDWRQEEEEAGPKEALQQELEEGEVKEEAGSTVRQVHDGRESRKEEKKPRSKVMVGMGLPFLTGISPAGFLSANKKQPGGTEHLIRVNGKPYPLAKIQLGRMGALHPANRLAAYLTGRVGLNRKKQGSSSSSSVIKPPQIQTSAPTTQPSVTLLKIPIAPSVLQPAALKIIQSAASSKPPAEEAPEAEVSRLVMLKMFPGPKGGGSLVREIPRAPGSSSLMSDPQVSSPVAPAGSQLLMLQVPRPPGKLPVPASAPPPSTSTSTSTGQRMVLQPVQTVTGGQYYRRPDGKLVQLVPIDQLTPVKPTQSAQKGLSPPPVLPAVTRQTPSFTVVNRTAPVATVTASSPLLPSSGFLGQKGMCTFKILPPSSSREPILVTCAKVPPQPPIKLVSSPAPGTFTLFSPHPSATPVNLISLKPSPGQGAEPGVKTVAVSAAPVGSGGLTVHQKPTSSQTTTTVQTLTASTIRPPPAPPAPTESKVTPEPSPPPSPVDRNRSELELEQELACDLVDLDIICVDDEAGPGNTVTLAEAKRAVDVVVLDGSSSSEETDNSSDFGDETDGEGQKEERLKQRYSHNELEKQRRAKMRQLFEGLRREVGITEKMSKVFTLNRAVQVIQKLRMTDSELMKTKMMLTKKRDHFLNTIAPATETRRHRSPETETGNKDADVMEVVDLLEETEELTENSSDEETVIAKATDPVTKTNNTVTMATGLVTKATDPVTMATGLVTKATDPVTMATDPVTMATGLVTATNSVAVEMVEETSSAQTRLDGDETGFDLEVLDAFRELGVVLEARHLPRTLLLQQAVEEIQTLQRETDRLRSLKICLIQQRKAFIREVAQRSGVSEKKILMKVVHLTARQRKEEEQHRAANQRPAAAAAVDGDSDSSARGRTVNDIIITSSYQLHQTPQAPPTLFYAPPTTTAVPTPVQTDPVTKATDPVTMTTDPVTMTTDPVTMATGLVTKATDPVTMATGLVTKATDPVTMATGLVTATNSVAVEMVEETSGAQTRLDGDETGFDLEVLDAFRELGVVLEARHLPRTLLLQQAVEEIQTLQRETDRLRSLKICLIQQRKAFIREVAQRSGVSEKKILMKVVHLTARQRKEEEQHRAANPRPAAAAAVDGDSDSSARGRTVNDIIITSSYQLHQTPQAPPTLFYAPPTTTAVQQPQTHSHMVLQVLNPTVPPPPVSHNASVSRDKQRTVPNILSRRKTSAPPSTLIKNNVEESQHFHAMVPTEVLSLVGTALPGQQVVTLSQLMAAPSMLQAPSAPGVASVTLNIPSLTNQQIHLTSVHHPPTASDFNSGLQLVQPPLQQEVPAPPAPVVPVGSDLSSDQIKDQDQSPTTRGPSPPPSFGPGTGLQAEVSMGSAVEPGEQQEAGEETVSLTSLLNELVFLNQQTVAGDQLEEAHAHSPWLLQLDSDSEDTAAMETEEAGLNDHTETTQSVLQPRTVNGNTTGGALAPPPLLQMKVGGANVADTASRPMPRLVPLGLRGNPLS
ncbi:MAX dimerization protein MGA a isoform 5-T5 [Acanthopagrus schlegelii]